MLSLSRISEAVGAPIGTLVAAAPLLAGGVAIAVCIADAVYNLISGESAFVLADVPFYMAIARGTTAVDAAVCVATAWSADREGACAWAALDR